MRVPTPPAPIVAALALKSLGIARGYLPGALAFSEGNRHPREVVTAIKGAVAAMGTADYPAADNAPVAGSFVGAMHTFSVPLRLLQYMIHTPMHTRIFAALTAVVASRIEEGTAMPVLSGNWTTATLDPVKHAGIVVKTEELVRSASDTAALALLYELAQAVAEEENRSFISPEVLGSVMYGAPHFNATGSTLASIDADLKRLMDSVPGAFVPGASLVTTQETATFLALVRGTGGAAAYPNITPQGGTLLGLPVLITSACAVAGSPPTRVIGLINPSEIVWADEGKVTLSASTEALLEMSDTPSGNSLTPAATTLVSMFQAGAVALRAVRESAWYARAGSGAYFVTGY